MASAIQFKSLRSAIAGLRHLDRNLYDLIGGPLPHRRWTAGSRLEPDFILIGAMRSGTTSLYRHLTRHPLISPAVRKEIHFFDRHYHRGYNWYRAHFPSATYLWIANALSGRKIITGEASTHYIFYPESAERMRRHLPGVKLIALLRNPIDRAYSHYWHQFRRGHETLSFAEAIRLEETRITRAGDLSVPENFDYHHFSYLKRGMYADQLAQWLKVFPRDQLLVLKSEDLKQNPIETLEKIYRYVDLAPGPTTLPKRRYNKAQYARLDPAIRSQLVLYFRPHNRRLQDLLQVELDWDK